MPVVAGVPHRRRNQPSVIDGFPTCAQQEVVMNHSLYSADARTHLKIVVVGLVCATLVAVIGVFGHVSDIDLGTAPLVKAGHVTAVSGQLPAVR
jgi:hypothetical protein